jgi:hypothetical protein
MFFQLFLLRLVGLAIFITDIVIISSIEYYNGTIDWLVFKIS